MKNDKKTLNDIFRGTLYEADKNLVISKIAQAVSELYCVNIYNGTLYIRFNGKDISNKKEITRILNNEITMTKKQFNELLYQLQIYAKKIDDDVYKIRLNNGIINFEDNEYKVIADDGSFCPFNIDVTYNPTIEDETVIKFIKDVSCNNDDIYNMLVELIGCVLMVEPKAQFMFFIYGMKGRNGKSTFTSMMSNFVGKENTTNINLSGFTDPTILSTINGKLLNNADDVSHEKIYLERSQVLKSIASGQKINCRAIYSMPIEFKNTATIVSTSNTMPEFADKSGGMRRRLIIIEFNMNIDKNNNDPNILDKLSTSNAKSTLLNIGLKGMNQIVNNNYFITENNTLNKTLDEYYKSTDTVKDFIETGGIKIEDRKVSEVYEAYETFCEETVCKEKESKNVFGMRMKQYGYISTVVTNKAKQSYRVYRLKK